MRYLLLSALLLKATVLSAFTMDETATQLILGSNPEAIYLEVIREDRPAQNIPYITFIEGRVGGEELKQFFQQVRDYAITIHPTSPLLTNSDSGTAVIGGGRTQGVQQHSLGVYPFAIKGIAHTDVYKNRRGYKIWALILEDDEWSKLYSKETKPFYLIIGEQLIDNSYDEFWG